MRNLMYLFAAFGLMLATTLFPATLHADIAGNNYLGYWNVELVGEPEFDEAANTTTFVYKVSSLCEGGKDLSHWVLGLDEGIVIDSASVEDVNYEFSGSGLETDPTTGMYGFKFDDGQPMCTSYIYIIKVLGKWCAVDGEFALKAGSNQIRESVAFGEVEVPGEGECGDGEEEETFSISGIVFIDVNGNAMYDAAEPVLGNVPILLGRDNMIFTESDGSYLYRGLLAGTYYVSVDIESSEGIAPLLEAYFTPVTPLSFEVTVGPDAEHIDFGFALNPGDVMISGEGKTIGFWKHQLSVIIEGKARAQVSKATMDGLIASVNGFFISDPFIITAYTDAFNVLSARSSLPHSLLLKQLLAAEFNKFYGIGLTDKVLMDIILQTAESYAFYSHQISAEKILEMKDLLDSMNNLEPSPIIFFSPTTLPKLFIR